MLLKPTFVISRTHPFQALRWVTSRKMSIQLSPFLPIPPHPSNLHSLPEYAADALRFFTSYSSYEFVKQAGIPGTQGGAFLFHERSPGGVLVRPFIVKYYDNSYGSGPPVNEWNILNRLRGAERKVFVAYPILGVQFRCRTTDPVLIEPPAL